MQRDATLVTTISTMAGIQEYPLVGNGATSRVSAAIISSNTITFTTLARDKWLLIVYFASK